MNDGAVTYRVRLGGPVDNARLAHEIARIIGQAPSKVHKSMRDEPTQTLFEFSIFSRDEFAPPGGVYSEEIVQAVSSFLAASVDPIIEEGIDGHWMQLKLKDLPSMIKGGADIRDYVRRITDLEIGVTEEGQQP